MEGCLFISQFQTAKETSLSSLNNSHAVFMGIGTRAGGTPHHFLSDYKSRENSPFSSRGGRPATTIFSPSHILLIFSSEPPLNPRPSNIVINEIDPELSTRKLFFSMPHLAQLCVRRGGKATHTRFTFEPHISSQNGTCNMPSNPHQFCLPANFLNLYMLIIEENAALI